MAGNSADCKDIHGLIAALNINRNPEQWVLFIHSTHLNLKAVLLHNDKALESITVRYAVNKKEPYNNREPLLNCIN
jgi:hypothetical protein